MTVAVVVPWSPGCPHREAAWAWARRQYEALRLTVVEGGSSSEPFSRSQAIIDGARRTDADILVVADADIWCDGLPDAIAAVDDHGWAVPHRLVHRLSKESTERVLVGADWRGLPLSTDNAQDRRPYVGNETGTLVILRRDVLEQVPPDPRFVGWGQEDMAWGRALRLLVGPPWRGDADLVHLWHPPQPRASRVFGSAQSKALWQRYRAARRPEQVRSLIAELGAQTKEAAWPAT